MAGGNLVTSDSGWVNIAHSLSVNNGATVDVTAGGSIDIGTVLSPLDRTVQVGFGGTLLVNGSVLGDVLTLLGGTISGTGTIDGKVIVANAGTQTARGRRR